MADDSSDKKVKMKNMRVTDVRVTPIGNGPKDLTKKKKMNDDISQVHDDFCIDVGKEECVTWWRSSQKRGKAWMELKMFFVVVFTGGM